MDGILRDHNGSWILSFQDSEIGGFRSSLKYFLFKNILK
jgi:hypothetical protein